MTPDRWRQVKEIFSTASELAGSERRAHLDALCREDAELRAEIESLLASHAVEDAIIDRPAVAQVPADLLPPAADRWLGRRIGAYEITALLGHGGMGQVYRARRVDAEYEKEVAIKLVPGGFQAEFVLNRLRAERQILANLEHPNIARLIDGGATDEGSPYLVMELVEGEPLDRYTEQRGLQIRDRLRLFRDVCAAVSYAHQRLVVHRDLKPNNILVTGDGTVKLLDFGIAKLLQATPGEGPTPTVTLMHALTPAYSSPEQILGRPITTASDVYSLGVVLYVLLTGQSPYRTALESTHDVIREVCEIEPVRPSAVIGAEGGKRSGKLDRDLDAIVLRALRKEPEGRYASVEQLSEDVRRYLEGLPVRARGDRTGYRARKFLRRRKLELAAAGLISVALIGATVVSLRQARIAAQQELRAEQERERAERHFTSVRRLADVFMFDVHDAIKDLPGSTDARELLVETALEYLNTLAAEAGGDPELQQELAAAYEKVAAVLGQAYGASKGKPHAALESYAKAVALLEPLVASDTGNARAGNALARDYLQQANLLLLLGDAEAAVTASQRAVAMFEARVESGANGETRRALSNAYREHAYTIDMADGHSGAGVVFAKKAVAILEELFRQRPEDSDLALELADTYSVVAITATGNTPSRETLDEALVFYRKAIEVEERLVAATGGRNATYVRELLIDRANAALVLNELEDYQGAVESARAAEDLLAGLESDASNVQARIDGASIAWPLGRALLALGELEEAAAVFERNAAVLDEITGEEATLHVQYLRGTMASGLGEVHSRLAERPGLDRAARLEEWRLAKSMHEKAIPNFERVTAGMNLDFMDRHPLDEAVAGLARSTAEILKLEAAAAGR